MGRTTLHLSSEHQRALVGWGVTQTWRAMVHALPWAALAGLLQAFTMVNLIARFNLDVKSLAWLRAPWEAAFDERAFPDALRARLVLAFDGTLDQVGSLLFGTALVIIVTTIWLQTVMTIAVRHTDRILSMASFEVLPTASYRFPAMISAWTIPLLATSGGAWVVWTGLEAGRPWIWGPVLGLLVVGLLFGAQRLTLVPMIVVEDRLRAWRSWWSAPVDSFEATRGRTQLWGLVWVAASLATAPIVVATIVGVAATTLVVPLSAGLLTAGITLVFGSFAAAGAAMSSLLDGAG